MIHASRDCLRNLRLVGRCWLQVVLVPVLHSLERTRICFTQSSKYSLVGVLSLARQSWDCDAFSRRLFLYVPKSRKPFSGWRVPQAVSMDCVTTVWVSDPRAVGRSECFRPLVLVKMSQRNGKLRFFCMSSRFYFWLRPISIFTVNHFS